MTRERTLSAFQPREHSETLSDNREQRAIQLHEIWKLEYDMYTLAEDLYRKTRRLGLEFPGRASFIKKIQLVTATLELLKTMSQPHTHSFPENIDVLRDTFLEIFRATRSIFMDAHRIFQMTEVIPEDRLEGILIEDIHKKCLSLYRLSTDTLHHYNNLPYNRSV